MTKSTPPQRSKWFWVNLVALLVLVPIATLLFERHFRPYFNQALLVGGAITLWTLIHLLWGIFATTTGFDAEDFSRQWLNTPAATRLLMVAAVLLAYLWWSAASLYFEFTGDAAKTYKIQVTRAPSDQNYLEPFAMSASERIVLKDLQLVGSKNVQLRCQVIDPVGFEPADCPIVPGKSTRIAVPDGFKPKEYHLVRLIPLGRLFQKVPSVNQVEPSNFYLEVSVHGKDGTKTGPERLDDLRRQTVSVLPRVEGERNPVQRLGSRENHVNSIIERYLQDHVDEGAAKEFAAVLGSNTREWPIAYLRQGDQLAIDVVRAPRAGEGTTPNSTRHSMVYNVTTEPVQNVWLSPP